jgi:hypothetical protein
MALGSMIEDAAARVELARWEALREAARAGCMRTLEQRAGRILSLSEACGPKSERYRARQRALATARDRFRQIRVRLGRPLRQRRIPGRLLPGVLPAIAIAEAIAGSFVFAAPRGSTFVFVFCLALAVLLLAEIAGTTLRQCWSERRHRPVWSSLFGLLAALSGLVMLTLVPAILLNAFGMFAAMNGAGALIVAILAFLSRDPDRDFDAAARAVDRHQRRQARTMRAFLRRKRRIVAEMAVDVAGHAANYKRASWQVVDLKRRLGYPPADRDRVEVETPGLVSTEAESGSTAIPIDSAGAKIISFSSARRAARPAALSDISA